MKADTTKHTPGPWEAHLDAIECHVFEKREGRVICKTPPTTYDGDAAECIANARLIAASPDLFQACKYALALLENMTTEDYSKGVDKITRTKLEAAIAKAESPA